jgi:hypothetical protein
MGTSSRRTQKAGREKPRGRRRIIFAREAWLEFKETVHWCDEQQDGLGCRFETEVSETLKRIRQNPRRFRLVGKTIRKATVKVFTKYSIYFHVEPKFIGVISIFHGARNPAELRRRVK